MTKHKIRVNESVDFIGEYGAPAKFDLNFFDRLALTLGQKIVMPDRVDGQSLRQEHWKRM